MSVNFSTAVNYQPAQYSSLPPEKEVNNNPSESKKFFSSTTAKIIGGTAALAILGTAIYCGMRGKSFRLSPKQEAKLQELITQGQMDETYLKIFKDTENLKGEEFVKTAYDKLADVIGLTRKPELIISKNQGSGISSIDSIQIPLGGLDTKAKQFQFIRHELEHAKQTEMIYRAFGKDALIDAYIERNITAAKMNNLICKKIFNGKINFQSVTSDELATFKEAKKAQMLPKTGMLDEVVETKGKILPDMPEYAEAQKYLEAARNYKSPGMLNGLKVMDSYFEKIVNEYKNNLLEANAFREGDRIYDMYEKFCEIIKNV